MRHWRTIEPDDIVFAGVISPNIKLFKAYGKVEKLYATKELETDY